ncbi:MAG: prepilin-type N-terminal cleavage/methylation domain-containing protein [Actinobacteria bacterium]|nr:prepilin-type N-terminal cleavage/methylation domain-containing protein [Actinomycetota bacterium]
MSTVSFGDERGFTFVELLVSMTIGLTVSFATLGAFDGFNRGVASTNLLTDAQDSARRDVAGMVRILRDAGAPAPKTGAQPSTIVSASASDVVFRSTSWPGESQTGLTAGTYHTQRLCLQTATQTVWFDAIRAGNGGPTTPGSACPSTASGWTHTAMARNVVNTTAQPLFRIGTSPVRSIGLTLRLEGGTTAKSRPLELNSGGTLRGALAPQVTAADVSVTRNSEGSGRPLLSLNLPIGSKLTSTTGAPPTQLDAGKLLLGAGVTGTVNLIVTNVLGLQTVLSKTVSC